MRQTGTALPCGCPVCFLESDEDKIIANQNWALDQHTVRSQQLKLLVLAHGRQFVLELQCLVLQTAGVEELLQRQIALLMPRPQLFDRRVVLLDVPLVE